MILSQVKAHLDTLSELNFIDPNGNFVPKHFHIAEAGLTTKHFIDCGGTVRIEKFVSLQLWVAQDIEHRLEPQKLKKIIALAEPLFGKEDLEIEIEYQTKTIGRYGLDFDGINFFLSTKKTDCLAKDKCGIPDEKSKVKLSDLQTPKNNYCAPGGACC